MQMVSGTGRNSYGHQSYSQRLSCFYGSALWTTYQQVTIYAKKGFIGNTSCITCGEEETLEHLLFRYNKALEVWKLCPWSITFNPATCSSFRESLQSSFAKVNLPPTRTSSNLFPWICWSLWTSRNQLLFDNRQASPAEILTKSINLLKEWEATQGLSPTLPASTAKQNPIQINSTAVILCNTDAAWNKDSKSAGLAWIFTDQTGKELNRGCLYQDHVSSPANGGIPSG